MKRKTRKEGKEKEIKYKGKEIRKRQAARLKGKLRKEQKLRS